MSLLFLSPGNNPYQPPYPQYRKKCAESGVELFFDKSTEFHKTTKVFQQSV